MPEPLDDALAALRPMLLDVDSLVRGIAAGRRRGLEPRFTRAELRPVDLKAGRRLQVVTTDGRAPDTRNHPCGAAAEQAVDELLAEPFGTWRVETTERVVQLRVTKRGEAQVHTARTAEGAARVEGTAGAKGKQGVEGPPGCEAAERAAEVAERAAEVAERAARPANGVRPHDQVREHLLDPGDPLFGALGADADKRRQVDAFLRQLTSVLGKARASAAAAARPLHVVDLGCGNAYLTFAAHRYLAQQIDPGVVTVGVELRPDLVARNVNLAQRLAMRGLGFVTGRIEDADPGLDGVDLVLALHACDTATDDALARAVRWQAPAVLAAPCCHHDVQRQLATRRGDGAAPARPFPALTRHAILRERFADVLTDALRAEVLRLLGYHVDVVEFVDSRHTPRNALVRATRTPPSSDQRRPAQLDERQQAQLDQRRAEYLALVAAWQVEPYLARLLAPELSAVGLR